MALGTKTSLKPQWRKHPNRFHQDYYDPGRHRTRVTDAIGTMTDNRPVRIRRPQNAFPCGSLRTCSECRRQKQHVAI
jgi:hypothetical protein